MLVIVSLFTGSLGALARGETSLDPRAWTFVLLAGLCGAGSWLAYFAALRIAPAAPVSALDRLSLPIVFVIAIFALGERPGALGWAGLGLVVLGTYLIVADPAVRSAG